MSTTIYLDVPPDFSFKHTVLSHGWYDLAPFELDEENLRLTYVFSGGNGSKPYAGVITDADGQLRIDVLSKPSERAKLLRDVRHLLRLDDDLSDFYTLIEPEKSLSWVSGFKAGRLLRSATVFEDLVKTICTTNCSWGLTKKMVSNLVDKLGEGGKDGKRAFPTAAAMAAVSQDFYRDEIKTGYRSRYFVELAEAVHSGAVDPESWLHSDLPTAELKKEMKKVKGVGDYAAENLLKLVGRYDGLALDSWLRSQFYKKHNREKVCADKKIEKHYKKYGGWKGLVIWCDMTERWFS